MQDFSIHKTSTGKVFQMFNGISNSPMSYAEGKHNYTKQNLATLGIGQTLAFMPLYGNKNPVYTKLLRLK